MTFKEVFEPPFRLDPGGYRVYIWCKTGMAFNLLNASEGERIVALLNGEEGVQPFDAIDSNGRDIITNGYAPLLKIRGWGRLTGTLGLDVDEALKIQNDFKEWAMKQLKKEL